MRRKGFSVVGFSSLRLFGQLAIVGACCAPNTLSAAPETSIEPYVSLLGASSGSRFGDALACSQVSATGGNRSLLAVGAPEEAGGAGAVYLQDPANPDAPLQRIVSPAPGAGLHFGAAITFVSDVNGDGADDLVVGEPSGSTGSIHVYGSNLSGGIPSYTFCASSAQESSFGAKLLGLRGPVGSSETLVAAAPASGTTYSLDLSGACSGAVGVVLSFTRFGQGGEFGAALAEVPSTFLPPVGTPGASSAASQVLVGQPNIASSGGKVSVLNNFGVTTELRYGEQGFGTSLAASHRSTVAAIGSPNRDGGKGGVDLVDDTGALLCSVASSAAADTRGFGSSVLHLEDSFSSLPGKQQQFVASRPEASTGGSLALFGWSGGDSSCLAAAQINNCEDDPQQEQGKVIVGGPDCIVWRGGIGRAAFAYSSPGWERNRGRVDIVVDGSESSSLLTCSGNSPIIPGEVPTPVEPGDRSLPAAQVDVSGRTVTVRLPLLQPSLTGDNYQRALRKLQRQERLSQGQARQALRRLEIIYVVSITQSSAASAASGGLTRPLARSSIDHRKKRNRFSLRNLKPGSYALTWRAIVATKRPPVEIGTAVSTYTTRFTVTGKK